VTCRGWELGFQKAILCPEVFIPFKLGHSVESGDLRQISEYPITPGEHYDSCILRRGCKSAFLILKRRYRV
jgi:hypothetical protein